MNIKGMCRDAGVLLLFALIFFIPAACLFFADGGQIYGINYNPELIPKPTGEVDVNGLRFIVPDDEIVPIDDGSKIVPIELWQIPLRDSIMILITRPIAYTPPSISKIISLLYLSLGLCFFILYRKKSAPALRPKDSRREQIYQCILSSPGISRQQITDKTGFSRGSVRHHLAALQNNQEIQPFGTPARPCYLPCTRPVSAEELTLRTALAQPKTGELLHILKDHPGATVKDIAARLKISPSTAGWRLQKLISAGIAVRRYDGKTAHYTLSAAADALYTGAGGGQCPAAE